MNANNIYMKKAMGSLAKTRTYCYMVLALYIPTFLYRVIGDWALGRQKVLFGMILITTLTIVITTFHTIAFASHIQTQKNKAAMLFYAARTRAFLIFQIVSLMVLALNFQFLGEIMIDILCFVTCLSLMAMALKYLTLLQRQDFSEYKKYASKYNSVSKKKKLEPVVAENNDEPKSRVGANKEKKASEKRRKSK
ncbi:MAG: hypothetical protein GX852_04700 [Clostridiales bacterium]|nr:hypothetical protein [Clostridiales bacterium]